MNPERKHEIMNTKRIELVVVSAMLMVVMVLGISCGKSVRLDKLSIPMTK